MHYYTLSVLVHDLEYHAFTQEHELSHAISNTLQQYYRIWIIRQHLAELHCIGSDNGQKVNWSDN